MNTDHLQEFVHLAETLSFTKTAEHFYTSRSVISRHIMSLEAELGVKLLNRDRHNVSLTKEGRAFCREANVLIKDYNHLLSATREAADGAERIARIGYLRNAARPYVAQFATYFKEKYPDITPVFSCMNYGELRKTMDEGRIDLALSMSFDGSVSEQYRAMRIYEDQFYAVMSKDDPLATHVDGLTSDDLAGRRLLLSESLACEGLSEYLVRAFGTKSAFIAFEFVTDADVTQLRLHVDGSIALRSGLNMPFSGDTTVTLPLLDVDLSFVANAYYKKDLDPVVAAAFKDTTRECRHIMSQTERP